MLCRVLPDFLGPAASELLEYAIANEPAFTSTVIGLGGDTVPSVRRSRYLPDLGEYRGILESAIRPRVAELAAELRLAPFECNGLELELVAHEHGAFYRRHIDLFTGPGERVHDADRVLSLVLYLHREPKRYNGGELRLYPEFKPGVAQERDALEVVPRHDMAVAFSSWLPHEVRPVTCPSRAFADARFAVNCWALRHRQGARR